MKIKIYIKDVSESQDIMNKVYQIVKDATGKEPNIRVINQSNLKV